MTLIVRFTWTNLNLRGPSAWDAAIAAYEKETGEPFANLPRDEQINYVRAYVNR